MKLITKCPNCITCFEYNNLKQVDAKPSYVQKGSLNYISIVCPKCNRIFLPIPIAIIDEAHIVRIDLSKISWEHIRNSIVETLKVVQGQPNLDEKAIDGTANIILDIFDKELANSIKRSNDD